MSLASSAESAPERISSTYIWFRLTLLALGWLSCTSVASCCKTRMARNGAQLTPKVIVCNSKSRFLGTATTRRIWSDRGRILRFRDHETEGLWHTCRYRLSDDRRKFSSHVKSEDFVTFTGISPTSQNLVRSLSRVMSTVWEIRVEKRKSDFLLEQ